MGQVIYHKCIIPQKGQKMKEKKTITITREEFKKRAVDATVEIVDDALKRDEGMGLFSLLLSGIIASNLETALFEEEKENGN